MLLTAAQRAGSCRTAALGKLTWADSRKRADEGGHRFDCRRSAMAYWMGCSLENGLMKAAIASIAAGRLWPIGWIVLSKTG